MDGTDVGFRKIVQYDKVDYGVEPDQTCAHNPISAAPCVVVICLPSSVDFSQISCTPVDQPARRSSDSEYRGFGIIELPPMREHHKRAGLSSSIE